MSQLRSIPCSKRPFRISCFSMPTEFEKREERERERESTVAGLVSSLRRSDTSRKTKRNEREAAE